MKNARASIAILAGLVLVIGTAFYFRSGDAPEQASIPAVATPAESASTTVPTQGEDSARESFRNQPGAITFIEQIGEGEYWSLAVDILTPNPQWIPGGSSEQGGFLINKDPKVRDLIVTAETETYRCDGAVATKRVDTAAFIAYVQDLMLRSKTESGMVGEFGYAAYFDIDGPDVLRIYEQCLP